MNYLQLSLLSKNKLLSEPPLFVIDHIFQLKNEVKEDENHR